MSARLIKNINLSGSSSPKDLISINGIVYFAADQLNDISTDEDTSINVPTAEDDQSDNEEDETSPEELDENESEDEESTESESDPSSSTSQESDASGTTQSASKPSGLWKSDGSEGGTVLLKSFDSVSNLVEADEQLYFVAEVGGKYEIWQSDGTQGGTTRVKDLVPGPDQSFPQDLFALDGVLFYSAYDAPDGKYPEQNGYELWRREGQGVGTRFFRNLVPDIYITDREITTEDVPYIVNGAPVVDADGEPVSRPEQVAVLTTETYVSDSYPQELTTINGNLFFTADSSRFYSRDSLAASESDLVGGVELWFSDGTESGTRPINLNTNVYDIYRPRDGTYYANSRNEFGTPTDGSLDYTLPYSEYWLNQISSSSFPRYLTAFKNRLFFVANNGINGFELWSVDDDGSDANLISDTIRPGLTSSSPEELTVVGDTLYFTAASDSGRQLYAIESSLGRFQSSGRIPKPKPVASAGRDPKNLTNIDGQLYYSSKSDLGRELWSARGTQGEFIADINPGGRSSSPDNFTLIQTLTNKQKSSSMFFTATDGERGIEIWRLPLNQKRAKPERYSDIFPGPSSSDPRKLLNSDQVLFFSASDGSLGRELWTLGPSIKGPTGRPGSGSSKIRISEGQTFVYRFTTEDDDEQWTINGGLDSKLFSQKKMKKKGELFFKQPPDYERPKDNGSDNIYEVAVRATDSESNLSSDQYIYVEVLNEREGGSGDGEVIEDINTEEDATDNESTDSDFDNQAGVTTSLVNNIQKGRSGSNPSGLEVFNESIFFSADNGKSGSELWASDGSSASTRLIKNINPGKKSSSPSSLINFNKRLYFSADDGQKGVELWASNGTKDGTTRVADINPGSSSSNPSNMTTLDGALLFAADDGQDGQEIWQLDPSNGKPKQLKNINSSSGSLPRDLINFDRKVYFSAEGNVYGRELWVSDGSKSGTNLFLDINPGGFSSNPKDLMIFKDNLYFTAESYFGGRQVWSSNGSAGGTNKLSPISSLQIFSDVEELTSTPDQLFYTAQTSIPLENETQTESPSEDSSADTNSEASSTRSSIGRELWTSRGPVDSMKLVLDIYEGPGSSDPTELTAIGNVIYFSADDGANGEELWISDGTDVGTQRLTDINPGAKNSSPRDITAMDGSVYFTAINDKTGRELWRLSESSDSNSLARVVQARKGSRSMRAMKRTKDEFIFNLPKEFGKNKADQIINFRPNDGDQIHLDRDVFEESGKRIDLVTVSSNRQLKAQQSQPSQFIYFEPKGQLYFDRNDDQSGYGKNAGLFAILKGGPDLTESDFKII